MFSRMEQSLKLDRFLTEGLPVHYLPQTMFVVGLLLLYIFNSHYADRTYRKVSRLQQQVEDLRADYTTLKAEYMYASKQSEVAKKVKEFGLEETKEPPFKIIVEESEY